MDRRGRDQLTEITAPNTLQPQQHQQQQQMKDMTTALSTSSIQFQVIPASSSQTSSSTIAQQLHGRTTVTIEPASMNQQLVNATSTATSNHTFNHHGAMNRSGARHDGNNQPHAIQNNQMDDANANANNSNTNNNGASLKTVRNANSNSINITNNINMDGQQQQRHNGILVTSNATSIVTSLDNNNLSNQQQQQPQQHNHRIGSTGDNGLLNAPMVLSLSQVL